VEKNSVLHDCYITHLLVAPGLRTNQAVTSARPLCLHALDRGSSSRCQSDLHCSGALRGVDWCLLNDVSGQPLGPISEGQVLLNCLTIGN
jgi:hypothetical protein